jgi:hypothetical protein
VSGDQHAVAQLRAFARSLQAERATAHGRRRVEIDRGLASVARGLEALGAVLGDESDEAQRSEQMRAVIDELFAASRELVEDGAELVTAIDSGGEDAAEAAAKLPQVVRDLRGVNRALKIFTDPAGGAVSH